MGWSEDERLLVITEDGTVRMYSDLQSDFTPFSLGHGAEEHGVQACKFWSSGFVALLGNNKVVGLTEEQEDAYVHMRVLPLPWRQTPHRDFLY